ncbi:TRAP transporter substrate-binding protein DctP [Pseudoprimorskyibacter insulae]|uniref:Solute-binding protein n=1 Tax=Pseudoprimorskyibacter insulae TaxID=1695997 RepID=A0A2R8AQQ9_9RHOB|nr:TRAP transporter substrate-binding protein DctP [Pseudoprimorskyibacter insulae]SPF78164.1 Solute-binding protein [Pseudoprimorskyibacter insulae]
MTLFGKLCLSAALSLGLTGAASAADFTMKIAAGAAPDGNVCKNYLDVWAEEVKEKSGGRIDYQMFCGGTLAKMGDAVNRVSQGVADVAWDLPGFYGARFAGLTAIGVPGLYTDPEPASGALWNAYAAGDLGTIDEVKVLWVQAVNNNSFFMAKPLEDYTNLNGTKMGMGSQIRAKVLEALNGVPIAIKVPEYYQAMSKGAVDGLMTTAGAVFDFGIEELVKEIYDAPFGGGLTFVVMNKDFYNSLPDDLKAVIDETTGYDRSKWASAYLRDEEHGTVTAAGINIRTATDAEVEALQPAITSGRTAFLASAPENPGFVAAIEAQLAKE